MDFLIRLHRISRHIFACACCVTAPKRNIRHISLKTFSHFSHFVCFVRIYCSDFAFHFVKPSLMQPLPSPPSQCRSLHRKMLRRIHISKSDFFFFWLLCCCLALHFSILFSMSHDVCRKFLLPFCRTSFYAPESAGCKIRFLHLHTQIANVQRSVWIFAFGMFSLSQKRNCYSVWVIVIATIFCADSVGEWMKWRMERIYRWLWWRSPQVDFHNRVVHINAGRT